jgi:sulfur-oxidizing protein SoxB
VLDLEVKNNRLQAYQFKLLPVFSNLLSADKPMQEHINKVRKPFESRLNEKLAVTEHLLYRADAIMGSFDQIILDILIQTQNADIAFTPGFRFGLSVLPGQAITYEDVMTHTAITYPMVMSSLITGERIKFFLEDIADNVFNEDPYKQQGGDMVRVGNMQYSLTPDAPIGKRINDMRLRGKLLQANKLYKVAAWANTSKFMEGIPIWDVVANYLRDKKRISIDTLNLPKINYPS